MGGSGAGPLAQWRPHAPISCCFSGVAPAAFGHKLWCGVPLGGPMVAPSPQLDLWGDPVAAEMPPWAVVGLNGAHFA